MTEPPVIAVVQFPGSNDDRDAVWALGALGAAPVLVWHDESELPASTGAVVLPGGFSYGDYLRCGAIASLAPAMDAVRSFAASGGPVLGICNGFQILCEAGLLPGTLRPEPPARVRLRGCPASRSRTPSSLFMRRCERGQELVLPVKHGDGAWFADAEHVRRARGARADRPSLSR